MRLIPHLEDSQLLTLHHHLNALPECIRQRTLRVAHYSKWLSLDLYYLPFERHVECPRHRYPSLNAAYRDLVIELAGRLEARLLEQVEKKHHLGGDPVRAPHILMYVAAYYCSVCHRLLVSVLII